MILITASCQEIIPLTDLNFYNSCHISHKKVHILLNNNPNQSVLPEQVSPTVLSGEQVFLVESEVEVFLVEVFLVESEFIEFIRKPIS